MWLSFHEHFLSANQIDAGCQDAFDFAAGEVVDGLILQRCFCSVGCLQGLDADGGVVGSGTLEGIGAQFVGS